MKKLIYTLSIICCISALHAQTQLWGTTEEGGSMKYGTIFSADANGNNLQTVYSFDYTNGSMPLGNLIMGANGHLYGVCELGGYGDSCCIFEFDPVTGTNTDVYDYFQATINGWDALSGLMIGADGKFYGTCLLGGT